MTGLIAIAVAGYAARGCGEPSGSVAARPDGPGSELGTDAGAVVEATRPLMGTLFAVKVWAPPGRGPAAAEATHAALDAVGELEGRISSWQAGSDTAKINRAAGRAVVPVHPQLRELLEVSARWARRTKGAFDVTGGALFELWGRARERGTLPSEQAIRAGLALVDHRGVELHGDGVRLSRAGMKLGFGSVGKGFAADCAAERLRDKGFADFVIDAGGDLLVSGSRNDRPWQVGVRDPRRGRLLATAQLGECAIATSGDYEQFLIVDGERFGHVIDPRNGWPARGVSSVVVVASSAADADALATGLFVLGPDEGLALVERASSVEALFVLEGGEVRASQGLALRDDILERVQ
ncbi:MAG: thiamine biosynthesis protein ApbE [Planctomycetes bacterium]|nr:thiamine biosynthesis protein ApbE [Planctomycetota bacterium]MDP6408861.1 FAD:protein FMN transferase [Planctomycetota bacterium]